MAKHMKHSSSCYNNWEPGLYLGNNKPDQNGKVELDCFLKAELILWKHDMFKEETHVFFICKLFTVFINFFTVLKNIN